MRKINFDRLGSVATHHLGCQTGILYFVFLLSLNLPSPILPSPILPSPILPSPILPSPILPSPILPSLVLLILETKGMFAYSVNEIFQHQ